MHFPRCRGQDTEKRQNKCYLFYASNERLGKLQQLVTDMTKSILGFSQDAFLTLFYTHSFAAEMLILFKFYIDTVSESGYNQY